jgi:hypothetical protein
MQFENKQFNPDIHDRWRALTVKQPYASALVTVGGNRNFGEEPNLKMYTMGLKSIEVRSRATSYRGDLLICSSAKPEIAGLMSGATMGLVELYDIKPVSEFTPEDWENTRIPEEKRKFIKGGYGWLMRNPRRVIEFPVKGQLGIYNLVYSKGVIFEYPQNVFVDRESWEMLLGGKK